MPLTGNKGAWSELYVFLKLLAEGKLYAADQNLEKIPDLFFPLVKILRESVDNKREYLYGPNIKIIDGNTGIELLSLPVQQFVTNSLQLFSEINQNSGRSFTIESLEAFFYSIDITSVTAFSSDKADIKIVVHDLRTGMTPTLGFSIKSMLGQNSTLFNAGSGTNFIFKLEGNSNSTFNKDNFNRETLINSQQRGADSKIAIRLAKLEDLGFRIKFNRIQSENLELNLRTIDSCLPKILSFLVYKKYRHGINKMSELLAEINEENPFAINLTKGQPFYSYKLKSFLTESALGMTPETVFTGEYDATGGIIIVKKTGDIVCYHIYNKNEFENYLLSHTKLEQASTSEDENNPGNPSTSSSAKPFKFGWVYEENGEYYIKLNLQIRFC